MATPLDDIKNGITTSNWKKVVKGYERLTGEKLECPKEKGRKGEEGPTKEALLFYADPASWKRGGDDFEPTPPPAAQDKGDRARKALGGSTEPEPDEEDDKPGGETPPLPAYKNPPSKVNPKQFEVAHGEIEPDDDRKFCRREPFRPPEGPNQFVPQDDLAPGEKKTTQWINENIKPTQRRGKSDPYFIEVTCPGCKKSYEVTREEHEAKEDWFCIKCTRRLQE